MYESTRGNRTGQSAAQAITLGMVPGGGLFVPSTFPTFDWQGLRGSRYCDVAEMVLSLYLPEWSQSDLLKTVDVYEDGTFEGTNPAPLVSVGHFGVLELWHGPTAAFKDMALQVLPQLLTTSINQLKMDDDVLILVATSGDTGKAALEGFKDREGTQIVVFYPDGGVSPVQERQMTTTDGENTHVVAVKGNFDQCQTAVKQMFASEAMKDFLHSKHFVFSSANSINWGRLLPQIVYYVWAYLQAVEQGHVKSDESMNVVVPTGNFGNLLAAYYAKRMGIPIGRIICASNQNNVLSDFFQTGVYQSQRPFYQTLSPSMDILISSNFERFLYEVSGRNAEKVQSWYDTTNQGHFSVDAETLENCQAIVFAGWASEEETLQMMARSYQAHGYVFDPHTAVAMKVYEDYLAQTNDQTYTVIVSTASPFKFAASVLAALTGSPSAGEDAWKALDELSEFTGWEIPRGLQGLHEKTVKPITQCEPDGIADVLQRLF